VREATIQRETLETAIQVKVNLDGSGKSTIDTGVGFLDHMLTHLSKHSLCDLEVKAKGDLHIDAHHTVEDIGICLGKAFLKAVGVPKGLVRYGHSLVPMDEALAEVALDFSGRPMLFFEADLSKGKVGDFDTELAEEFLRAFVVNARLTAHIMLRHGNNSHHCIEGIFKALGRALRQSLEIDPRIDDINSTKGMLEA